MLHIQCQQTVQTITHTFGTIYILGPDEKTNKKKNYGERCKLLMSVYPYVLQQKKTYSFDKKNRTRLHSLLKLSTLTGQLSIAEVRFC